MISRILPKIISAGLLFAAAVLLYAVAPRAAAQTSGGADAQAPQLDYEFFKTKVEPIFLKKRSDEHARCYVCHQMMRHGGGPLSLEMLPAGRELSGPRSSPGGTSRRSRSWWFPANRN